MFTQVENKNKHLVLNGLIVSKVALPQTVKKKKLDTQFDCIVQETADLKIWKIRLCHEKSMEILLILDLGLKGNKIFSPLSGQTVIFPCRHFHVDLSCGRVHVFH